MFKDRLREISSSILKCVNFTLSKGNLRIELNEQRLVYLQIQEFTNQFTFHAKKKQQQNWFVESVIKQDLS